MVMTFFYSVNNSSYQNNSNKLHFKIRNLNNKLDSNDKSYKKKLKNILKKYNKKNNDNLKTKFILKKNRRRLNNIINNKKNRRIINNRRIMNNRKIMKNRRRANKYIMSRDRKVLDDPIFPPERRLGRHIYRNNVYNHFNIPSRGYPDNYQILGILTRNSDEKNLQLFGRQTYPGSRTYEYFVTGNDLSGLQTKIPLKTSNNKQIHDNDMINVPQLNSSKGKFKVSLYDLNAPVYNPNII